MTVIVTRNVNFDRVEPGLEGDGLLAARHVRLPGGVAHAQRGLALGAAALHRPHVAAGLQVPAARALELGVLQEIGAEALRFRQRRETADLGGARDLRGHAGGRAQRQQGHRRGGRPADHAPRRRRQRQVRQQACGLAQHQRAGDGEAHAERERGGPRQRRHAREHARRQHHDRAVDEEQLVGEVAREAHRAPRAQRQRGEEQEQGDGPAGVREVRPQRDHRRAREPDRPPREHPRRGRGARGQRVLARGQAEQEREDLAREVGVEADRHQRGRRHGERRHRGARRAGDAHERRDHVAGDDQGQEPARDVHEVGAAVREVAEAQHLRDEQAERGRLVADRRVGREGGQRHQPVGGEQPHHALAGPLGQRAGTAEGEEAGHHAEAGDAELAPVHAEHSGGPRQRRHHDHVRQDDQGQGQHPERVEAVGAAHDGCGSGPPTGSIASGWTSASASTAARCRRARSATTIDRKSVIHRIFSYSALMKQPATT
jgi:hypothetical protein